MRLEVEPTIKRVLSPEEEARLLAACETRPGMGPTDRGHAAHAIVILVEGGFRPREFFSMKKSQVNLLARQVTVISYMLGRLRKSAQPKRRIIPITDRALPHYQALMATEGEKLYPYGSLKKVWATICKEANVEGIWLRWLLDTAKYRWELAGLGPFEIALLMGHSSPQMTMAYSIVDQTRVIELAQ
jgi:integrase